MRKSIFKSRSACSSLTAALALAIAFNFSCSENKDDRFDYCITADGCLKGPFTASTCNGQLSNSCPNGYSSSSAYESVQIDFQIWQKYNLNEAVPGSRCYGDDSTYCEIYGRLYDWATAMDLPSSCIRSSCASQVRAKHKGVCPSGWHIPSDDEWRRLASYVGGSSIAGEKLRANSTLWKDHDNGHYGISTDDYGFSALPGGGFRDSYGFYDIGRFGLWWSATEYSDNYAYGWDIYCCYSSFGGYDDHKEYFRSVRCLKNDYDD